jgi:hypothetical protein
MQPFAVGRAVVLRMSWPPRSCACPLIPCRGTRIPRASLNNVIPVLSATTLTHRSASSLQRPAITDDGHRRAVLSTRHFFARQQCTRVRIACRARPWAPSLTTPAPTRAHSWLAAATSATTMVNDQPTQDTFVSFACLTPRAVALTTAPSRAGTTRPDPGQRTNWPFACWPARRPPARQPAAPRPRRRPAPASWA